MTITFLNLKIFCRFSFLKPFWWDSFDLNWKLKIYGQCLSHLPENGSFLIFRQMELSSPKIKLQEGHFQAEKNLKTLWKNFLYFRKWNFLVPSLKNSTFSKKNIFLIFQEGTCKAQKTIFFIRNIRINFYFVNNKLRQLLSLKKLK